MNIVITAKNTADLIAQFEQGTAQVHSERTDGTFRRRHFLVDGSDARSAAEWIRVQHDGQEADEAEGIPAVAKRTMRSIANELHLSVAAVRRCLVDLAITEEIEQADEEELAEFLGQVEEATN